MRLRKKTSAWPKNPSCPAPATREGSSLKRLRHRLLDGKREGSLLSSGCDDDVSRPNPRRLRGASFYHLDHVHARLRIADHDTEPRAGWCRLGRTVDAEDGVGEIGSEVLTGIRFFPREENRNVVDAE
jgi:hypothetical protein